MKRKGSIERYDTTITEPPFLTIPLDECEVDEPENMDIYDDRFSLILRRACFYKGYDFKFYSPSSDEGIDYKLVVY